MDFIIIMLLGILGAALVAGGIVAYRGSKGVTGRAFGAAAVAAGVVMWAIILVIVPTSSTGGGSPDPTVVFGSPTPSPTPMPIKEWNIETIRVDGSTVTVSLRVYAGIDVWATLEGNRADQVVPSLPIVDHIFRDVTPGEHTVDVQDVVGHSEARDAWVIPPETPAWLKDLIRSLEDAPVADPPASITRYEYKGETVYFVPQRCCDIFSDLYDADGTVIGHPDGGIAGQGDGRVPDFFHEHTGGEVIWRDFRTHDPSLVQVPAPIESVDILILESFPVQYMLHVVSGLPNGCASFGGYTLTREDDTIQVTVTNLEPVDRSMACTEEYRTVEHNISLGSDFVSGVTYTVLVSDVTETFTAQ